MIVPEVVRRGPALSRVTAPRFASSNGAAQEIEKEVESSGEDRTRAREGDRIQHCPSLSFELQEDVPRLVRPLIAAWAVLAEVDEGAAADG
jgi:hypothetical protein